MQCYLSKNSVSQRIPLPSSSLADFGNDFHDFLSRNTFFTQVDEDVQLLTSKVILTMKHSNNVLIYFLKTDRKLPI